MPYKDPKKRLENMRRWRAERTKTGYGQAIWLYRKQRWENEKRLRQGIQEALAKLQPVRTRHVDIDTAIVILEITLREAPEAKTPMQTMKEG